MANPVGERAAKRHKQCSWNGGDGEYRAKCGWRAGALGNEPGQRNKQTLIANLRYRLSSNKKV